MRDKIDYLTHAEGVGYDDIAGTSFVNVVLYASYDEVVGVFGDPLKCNDGKSDVEWLVNMTMKKEYIEHNFSFSIYNWKSGPAANGRFKTIDAITDWHIGSKSGDKYKIMDALDELFPHRNKDVLTFESEDSIIGKVRS